MDENVVIKISGLQIVENTGDNVEVTRCVCNKAGITQRQAI